MKPPKVDLDLGMLTYLTEGPSLKGRLREKPSDFVVDEVLKGLRASISLREGFGSSHGKYVLLVGARIGKDTLTVASLISKHYKDVRYSGLKDKRSVAFQYFTARGAEKEIKGRGFLVKPVGKRELPLRRGENEGNWFYIRVRGVSELNLPSRFPNFFSYQRFGVKRPYNHEIGRALVRREFREAIDMIKQQGHLSEANPNIQSIVSAIGKGLARLYVHSYQSYLFNILLSKRLEEGLALREGDYVLKDGWILTHPEDGDLLLPVPGGFTKTLGGWLEDTLNSLLREEGVKLRDFLFKEVPDVSGFGDFRKALESPKDLKIFKVESGFILSFFLSSGVYATSLLREVLKPRDPLAQGFL